MNIPMNSVEKMSVVDQISVQERSDQKFHVDMKGKINMKALLINSKDTNQIIKAEETDDMELFSDKLQDLPQFSQLPTKPSAL